MRRDNVDPQDLREVPVHIVTEATACLDIPRATELAEDYGRPTAQIEEAIRFERKAA